MHDLIVAIAFLVMLVSPCIVATVTGARETEAA